MAFSLDVVSDNSGNGGRNGPSDGNQEREAPFAAVRYGRMNWIGEFSLPPKLRLGCGARVVIATDRGIEIGEHVSLSCGSCGRSVTREQIREYVRRSGPDSFRMRCGRILREATHDDLIELRHIESQLRSKLEVARRFAADLGLKMKIVDCEHIFGGERIVFYFLADGRVDFRELVRRLAGEFQTRIELRQIGARDEARLLADYETCGRECCCKNFLKNLKPVNMHMAKLQKATLDPSKVSGRCGRLKCCLRYEHQTYEELAARLPRTGSWVRTAEGVAQVVERQILTQLLRLQDVQGRTVVVPVEDLLERDLPPPPPPAEPDGEETGSSRAARGDRRVEPRPLRDEPWPVGEEADVTDLEALADEDSPGTPPADESDRSLPGKGPSTSAGDRPQPRGSAGGSPRDRRRRRGGRRNRGGPSDRPGGPSGSDPRRS